MSVRDTTVYMYPITEEAPGAMYEKCLMALQDREFAALSMGLIRQLSMSKSCMRESEV
ncbi:hypothetical protein D3C75_1158660 [compost metagenome]